MFYNNRNDCKECNNIRRRNNYIKNKVRELNNKKIYYQNNKDIIVNYQQKYRDNLDNKKRISKNKKQYYIDNHNIIKNYRTNHIRMRRKNDPIFRIRCNISRIIAHNIDKKSCSIKKYLPYSIEELKEHLEKQFEPWMNWNNQGKYNSKIWDDNDPTTWKWQLDHIIPHSTFKYTSMQDQEFKDCWALSNLRPYSAKQNLLDGTSRIRHSSVI
jgi:hypothetical protein